jgi:hypothetical protein
MDRKLPYTVNIAAVTSHWISSLGKVLHGFQVFRAQLYIRTNEQSPLFSMGICEVSNLRL